MKYHKENGLIVPEHEKGEHEDDVLVALAMAGYELSDALDADDPVELFPSKGFLLRREAEEFISDGPYGPQLVMDIAFDRLVMVDVRPERHYDPENGHADRFVLNVEKFGEDRRGRRTVRRLICRANAILPDVQERFGRILGVLEARYGTSALGRLFVPRERVTPPPWPADAFDHEATASDTDDIEIEVADPDMPELLLEDIDTSIPGPDVAFLALTDEVWPVPDDHELDIADEDIVTLADPVFADGSTVHWTMERDGVIEVVERMPGAA